MFSSVDILEVAMQLERNGEKILRQAVKEIQNHRLKTLLEWMADQEQQHLEWFREIKNRTPTPFSDPKIQEMGKEILQDTVQDASFSLKDVDFSKMEEIKHLLEVAIEFENDTILFYDMIRTFVEDADTLNLLDIIISEEQEHEKLLREFVETEQIF